MIKFFRNIRKTLLIEGKTSKYLKYAIGEIILVVIGILIALQINNWNENLKKRKVEQFYLNELKEEFTNNLNELDMVMDINSNNADNALKLSTFSGPEVPQLSDERVNNLLFNSVLKEVQYRPRPGILNEIINTGKLELISNKDLRTKLSSWDGLLLKVRFQEEEHSKPRFKILDLIYSQGNFRKGYLDTKREHFELDQSKFKTSNLKLLQSQEFDNLLSVFYLTSRYLNSSYYASLRYEIEQTLLIINQELNTN